MSNLHQTSTCRTHDAKAAGMAPCIARGCHTALSKHGMPPRRQLPNWPLPRAGMPERIALLFFCCESCLLAIIMRVPCTQTSVKPVIQSSGSFLESSAKAQMVSCSFHQCLLATVFARLLLRLSSSRLVRSLAAVQKKEIGLCSKCMQQCWI